MNSMEMLWVAKFAATQQNTLPNSTLGKVYSQHQKMFNAVKAPNPMKFKGENVTGSKNEMPKIPGS
jgi:hypothetical protein